MKLNGYEKIRVVQRDKKLGCIPAGIEWMIRYKGIPIQNIDDFQERFNIQARGEGLNNFGPITEAVKKKYPDLKFEWITFPRGKGNEKMQAVEQAIKQGNPCLYSLYLLPFPQFGNLHSYHIMPVVEITDNYVIMLNGEQRLRFKREVLVEVHNNFAGGDDILILC